MDGSGRTSLKNRNHIQAIVSYYPRAIQVMGSRSNHFVIDVVQTLPSAVNESKPPMTVIQTTNELEEPREQSAIEEECENIKTSFNYCSSGSGQNSIIPVVSHVPE